MVSLLNTLVTISLAVSRNLFSNVQAYYHGPYDIGRINDGHVTVSQYNLSSITYKLLQDAPSDMSTIFTFQDNQYIAESNPVADYTYLIRHSGEGYHTGSLSISQNSAYLIISGFFRDVNFNPIAIMQSVRDLHDIYTITPSGRGWYSSLSQRAKINNDDSKFTKKKSSSIQNKDSYHLRLLSEENSIFKFGITFLYTKEAAGQINDVQSWSNTQVAMINGVFANIGMPEVTFQVARIVVDNASSTDSNTAIQAATNSRVAGDLFVARIVTADQMTNACGVGYLECGYNINCLDVAIRLDCALPLYVLPHEIGHNLGLQHDVANTNKASSYPNAYGISFNTVDGSIGDIMSYADNVIPIYTVGPYARYYGETMSNSFVNGMPMGSAMSNAKMVLRTTVYTLNTAIEDSHNRRLSNTKYHTQSPTTFSPTHKPTILTTINPTSAPAVNYIGCSSNVVPSSTKYNYKLFANVGRASNCIILKIPTNYDINEVINLQFNLSAINSNMFSFALSSENITLLSGSEIELLFKNGPFCFVSIFGEDTPNGKILNQVILAQSSSMMDFTGEAFVTSNIFLEAKCDQERLNNITVLEESWFNLQTSSASPSSFPITSAPSSFPVTSASSSFPITAPIFFSSSVRLSYRASIFIPMVAASVNLFFSNDFVCRSNCYRSKSNVALFSSKKCRIN